MANQPPNNYGLPSFGTDPQSLVQPVQITPGRLSVTPPASNVQAALARRDRRAERKAISADQRRMLLASVLSGPMATGITSLLGKVFPKLTEEPISAGYPSLEGLNELDRAQIERGREVADSIYGRPGEGQKRGLSRTGRIVRDMIAAAPGLAAKTPEGLKLFQSGRESMADVEAAITTARATKSAAEAKDRTDLIGDIAKEDITRAMFHGAILQDGQSTPTAVSRVGATMKDGRVMFSSKGQPFDRDVDGTSVEAGKWYFNPALAARLVKAELKTYADVRMKNQNSADPSNPEYLSFFPRDVVRNGRTIREYVAYQGGKQVTQADLNAQGDNWVKASDQEVATATREDLGFSAGNDSDNLQSNMFTVAHRFLSLAEGAQLTNVSPQSLAGTLANAANDLRVNLSSVFDGSGYSDRKGFTNHLQRSFSDKNGDFQGHSAIPLFDSLNTYLNNVGTGGKSAHPQALKVFKEDLESFFRNTQQAEYSLAGNFVTEEAHDEFFGEAIKSVRDLSADRALMMAAQLQLGYLAAAAAGQTGRTLSDKDLAFFLRIVGFGESSDPRTQAEAVTMFVSDQIYRAENEAIERNFDYLRDGDNDVEDVELYLQRTLGISAEDIRNSKADGPENAGLRRVGQANIRHKLNRSDFQAGNHFKFDPENNTWLFLGKRDRLRTFNNAKYFFKPWTFIHPNTGQEIEMPGWLEEYGVNRFYGEHVDVRRGASTQGAPTTQGATDADSDAAAAAAMKNLGLGNP